MKLNPGLGKKMVTLGLIFLAIGFVLQGLTFTIDSDLLKVGLVITILGALVVGINRFMANDG